MAIARKNQLVGLDIGSHSIKLVEIDNTKKGLVLKNVGQIGLPPDAIVEGSVKEPEIVISALKSLFANLKVKNRNIATAVSGYSVIVKKIAVPKKNETDLESTIHDEAEQYIPFDINDVNLDFDILASGSNLGDGERPGKNEDENTDEQGHMEVMLVAAKKDIIEDYVNLLNSAGLSPAVIDVDSFAFQNAFEMNMGDEKDSGGTYALINVGAEELGINAVSKGVSLFTRDSGFGGFQITQAIMSKFKVPYEEAEKIKLGGAGTDKDPVVLEEIFTSVVSGWVHEIKRALDFVVNTYPEETISKLIVSGGACRIPGFQQYLQQEAEVPVEEFNPFRNLKVNEKAIDREYLNYMAPRAAVAVGLALRSIGDK
jgi:type IV pilus assembly protein PilM